MPELDDVLFLSDPQAFEDLRSGQPLRALQARKSADRGSISVTGDVLRFSGAKGTVELSPVRGLSLDGWVKVEYGAGNEIRTAYVSNPSKLAGKRANSRLLERLREQLGATSATPDAELERHRRYEREEAGGKARVRMWIGGVAAVIGILVTVISYSAASGGGTYYVAWGAIFFGGLVFLSGLSEWRRSRGG